MRVQFIKAPPPKIRQGDLAPGTVFCSPGSTLTCESELYLKTQHGAVNLDFNRSSLEQDEQSYFDDEEHGEDLCVILGRLEVKL